MRHFLAACSLAALLAGTASAWEAKASKVADRLRALSSLTAAMPAKRAPGWAKRPGGADGRVHWTETYGGKTYVFAAGRVENVENPSLKRDAAEAEARVSLAYAVGDPGGGSVSAKLERSLILDWYQDPKGAMSALAVLIR